MALRKSGYAVIECSDGIEMLTHLTAFLLPDEFAKRPGGPDHLRYPNAWSHRPGGAERET